MSIEVSFEDDLELILDNSLAILSRVEELDTSINLLHMVTRLSGLRISKMKTLKQKILSSVHIIQQNKPRNYLSKPVLSADRFKIIIDQLN